MKCKICGAESGKYPLCRACNIKKDKGEIIKCEKCGQWHYANTMCPSLVSTPVPPSASVPANHTYLYNPKKTLISKSEQSFFNAIKCVLPDGYSVFPQINLASFIDRSDDARFHNELFRNVDFLITDAEYTPKFIIEINDQSHLNKDRKERDEKIQKICEEAGIPILKLWTCYGVNLEYIKARIDETLIKLPIERVHNFYKTPTPQNSDIQNNVENTSNKKKGCYIATYVYGSYDCPEVWVLRRYRDTILSKCWYGKLFIKIYYTCSPIIVKLFGKCNWFINICKSALDNLVENLQLKGFENNPYTDK